MLRRSQVFTAAVSVTKAHKDKKKQYHVTRGGNGGSSVPNMPKVVILKEKLLKMFRVVRKKIKFDDISPTQDRIEITMWNAQAT